MITLPAITVWQPYASLIAIRAKPHETRDYPPPAKHIGKRIAIHAAVRRFLLDDLTTEIMHAFQDHCPDKPLIGAPDALLVAGMPYGAVVCTAVLSAAYQCGETIEGGQVFVTRSLGDRDRPAFIQSDSFGDFSPRRWAWHLDDIEKLELAVPAVGRQGWWQWTQNSRPSFSPPASELLALF